MEARLLGKQVLVEQIKDRHKDRMRQLELKERESELMRQAVEKMRLEDERKAKEKHDRSIQMKQDTE